MCGCLAPSASPAVQAILPELVPDHAQLPAASALIDSSERTARLVGPFIVGALAGLLPEKHVLTPDALSFLAAALAAFLLPAAANGAASAATAPAIIRWLGIASTAALCAMLTAGLGLTMLQRRARYVAA